jgi:hypothetical protein
MGDRGQQYAIAHRPWHKIAQQALLQYQALIGRPIATTYTAVAQTQFF